MKKRLLIFGLWLATSAAQAATFSKTFFSVVPKFQAGSPEKETMFRDVFTNNTGRWCVVEAVGFGGQTRDDDDLAKYFLPFGKSEILVTEANATDVADRDVDAIHLNINHLNGQFQSKVKFDMHQTFAGIGLAVRAQVPDEPTGWWVGVSTPFMFISNHVELCETVENPGDALEATRVPTVTAAFKQSIWEFGRVDGCDHSKTGFADVELQVGYKWGEADEGHADVYVGAVIPTGNKPCGKVVFEPMVGNNHHFGILFGGTLLKDIYATSKQTLSLLLSTNGRYLFKNRQRRSFDLKDKHWGRYMEVYASLEAAEVAFNAGTVADGDHGSPGINVFTQKMKVTPGFANQLNAALVYKENWLMAELGYNVITRQAEKTCLSCWQESAALVSTLQNGNTTKFRTINHAARGDEGVGTVAQTYKPLTRDDLDISSAAHPAVFGQELYAAFGVRVGDSPDAIPLISVGGSWEFASGNTAVDRWTLWAKFGVEF